MTVEQISDLIKSVGLVVVGLWAAWTFYHLQKIRDAKLGIAAKQMANEEQSRRLLGAQPQLVVQLNASEMPSPTDQYKSVLSVTVILSNLGTQNLLVRFRKHTLSVAKIELGKIGPQGIRNVQFFAPLYFDDRIAINLSIYRFESCESVRCARQCSQPYQLPNRVHILSSSTRVIGESLLRAKSEKGASKRRQNLNRTVAPLILREQT
jgi:hypothetical protein